MICSERMSITGVNGYPIGGNPDWTATYEIPIRTTRENKPSNISVPIAVSTIILSVGPHVIFKTRVDEKHESYAVTPPVTGTPGAGKESCFPAAS
jgi:hypothetical protein